MPEQTETVVESKGDIAEKARRRTTALQSTEENRNLQRTSTMEIGWIARGMKVGRRVRDPRHGRNSSIGVGRAGSLDVVPLDPDCRGLQELKKSEYLKLIADKAYIGLKLPESDRIKQHWLGKMCDPKISTDDFENIVTKKIEVRRSQTRCHLGRGARLVQDPAVQKRP